MKLRLGIFEFERFLSLILIPQFDSRDLMTLNFDAFKKKNVQQLTDTPHATGCSGFKTCGGRNKPHAVSLFVRLAEDSEVICIQNAEHKTIY